MQMAGCDASDDFFASLTAHDSPAAATAAAAAEPGIRVYIGAQPVFAPEPDVRVLPCCSPDSTYQPQGDDDADQMCLPELPGAAEQHAPPPVFLASGDVAPPLHMPTQYITLEDINRSPALDQPALAGCPQMPMSMLPLLPSLVAPTLDDDDGDGHYSSPLSASFGASEVAEPEAPEAAALRLQAVLRDQIEMKRRIDRRRRRCVNYGDVTDPAEEARRLEAGAKSGQKRLTTLHTKCEEFRTCGPPGVTNSFIIATYNKITGDLRVSASDDLKHLASKLRVDVFSVTGSDRA